MEEIKVTPKILESWEQFQHILEGEEVDITDIKDIGALDALMDKLWTGSDDHSRE